MLKPLEDEKKSSGFMDANDRHLVSQILGGNSKVAAYFLTQKCTRIFEYIINTRLRGLGLQTDDLVNDFYIYLQENDWEKLRQFRFESQLLTWIYLVAARYLVKKYARELKENSRNGTPIESISTFVDEDSEQRIVRSEILEAISYLKDKRCRQLLLLGFQGFNSDEIADRLGINTNNVYVIRSRAIKNLKNLLNG
jgi:RNA polymerase sigma factor (sigma-70 family)